MNKRVVITGLGVISPNGTGLEEFKNSIYNGKSGIKLNKEILDLGLSCHIAGIPEVSETYINKLIPSYLTNRIETTNVLYGMLAGIEAWINAGLSINQEVDWDTGVIMGMQTVDGNYAKDLLSKVHNKRLKSISGRTAEQSITSSLSSYLSGYIGLGNCSVSNSSACATGTESIFMAYKKIKHGESKRILVGSSESNSPFIWSALDRIRVLIRRSNDNPSAGSKPMSKDAAGLVPACGAGALVLEDYEAALSRGAHIYGEIIGGHNNSGGQRTGGSMTNPNPEGMKRCIENAISEADIDFREIDLISGHLTATHADPIEVKVWASIFNNKKDYLPYINSLKSMTGHSLAAAGSIESVAVALQLEDSFIHPSINCIDVHPEIIKYWDVNKIPHKTINKDLNIIAKANFGFGDVNTCLIFKKIKNE